jgi:beta-glucosidase
MPSFSQWTDGTYMHCNSALLTTWLKTQQGFDGFVVGDWEAHSACGGISQSMAAGLDMPMAPSLGAGVNASIPFNARTQAACKSVLRIKYRMNLFNQYNTDSRITSLVGSTEHRDAVGAAVRASLVLLKNSNSALPIPKTASVAVWGQGGNDVGIQCGGWTVSWQGSTGTPTPGTTIYQGVQSLCTGGTTYSSDGSNSGNASYIIAVLSENPYAETSFSSISLTSAVGATGTTSPPLGTDYATSTNASVINNIATAHAAGKKVIAVLMAGRPLDITGIISNCDAFVWASLPGTEGLGVAQVFFNDQGYHFSGKLPVSFPGSSTNYEPANGGALYAAGTGINPF